MSEEENIHKKLTYIVSEVNYLMTIKNWKLIRERDGLTKLSNDILFVEWNEDNTFKQTYDEPLINTSLMMSPFNDKSFTWLTTPIIEITQQKDDYIKFKTENSVYELFKINHDEKESI